IKYRFVAETESIPQIGIFPLVEIPTGDKSKGLGNGKYQLYLPVWLQKSWGKLTTYCGAGYWINPGPGNQNWTYSGWEVQYDFSDVLTLGGEVYYHTPDSKDSNSMQGYNVGGFINPDETNHILFSIGSAYGGEKTITAYVGYQKTI
ncbi:MAG: hypothetical protein P4L45_09420, partial [Ignavibacteriaceae bacterium]|nr:hypothetical protein [Ignavibacteriaceae bacterium]